MDMIIQKKYRNSLKYVLMSFFLIFTYSCSSKADFAGIYQTDQIEPQKRTELELDAEGEGYWRVGDEEESFSWYRKGDEIRLYTRKGGVIVAKILDGTLEIVLKRGETLHFKKIK
jgi:hypothetical protein